MRFIAFEISLNGDRLYTVGAEEWQTIWAHVLGHRISPDIFPPETFPPGVEISEDRVTSINFSASVSIPVAESERSEVPSQRDINISKTGSYPGTKLKVGDVPRPDSNAFEF
jgi:hypothetical protein